MRIGRFVLIFATLAPIAVWPRHGAGEAPAPRLAQFEATYDVAIVGVELGTFDVTAKLGAKDYALTADGNFYLLAGLLYAATGKSTSRGKLDGGSPEPVHYTLAFNDSENRQEVRIAFAEGAVRNVDITPKKRPDKRAVPIPDGQLTNVLDPLTAAFLSVRSDVPPGDPGVCDRTIRVFEGLQRFDLAFSPKRIETLSAAPEGVSNEAAVCQVRYKPIGGYRPDHSGVQFVRDTEGIEAWLVAVPGTGIYLPYKIVMPTGWGDGTIALTGLEVATGAIRRSSTR